MDILHCTNVSDEQKKQKEYLTWITSHLNLVYGKLIPSWQCMFDITAEDKSSVANAFQPQYAFFVQARSIVDINQYLRILFGTNENNDIKMIIFYSTSDVTRIFIDGIYICNLITIPDFIAISNDELLHDLLPILNFLQIYLAPETSTLNTKQLQCIFDYFISSLENTYQPIDKCSNETTPCHKLMRQDNLLYATGLWELSRHYNIIAKPCVFCYISLRPTKETLELASEIFGAFVHHTSPILVFSANIGTMIKIFTNTNNQTNRLAAIIIVPIIQMAIPITINRTIPLIYHFFFACIQALTSYKQNPDLSRIDLQKLFPIAADIMRTHISEPHTVKCVYGSINSARYAFSRRRRNVITTAKQIEVYTQDPDVRPILYACDDTEPDMEQLLSKSEDLANIEEIKNTMQEIPEIVDGSRFNSQEIPIILLADSDGS